MTLDFATDARTGRRFHRAFAYATELHAGQVKRIDGRPYIDHLRAVADLVLGAGGSENEAIAALLHDAAEDHGGRLRLADIRARFGDQVAEIVDQCTDTYVRPRPAWRVRKERYLDHLAASTDGALLVSLADKIDNARALVRAYLNQGEELWSRSGRRPEDVRWYYGALARRFEELRPGRLAAELERAVSELARLIAEPPMHRPSLESCG